jgi:RNA polymerase sigma-70 factor, ECF subfamily
LKVAPESPSTPVSTRDPSAESVVKPNVSVGTVAQIYNEYFDFVWRNARRLGVPKSSAEDVVQEVFIVVQRRLPDFDGRAHVRSWLFGILVLVVRRYHRGFRRKDARCVPLERETARAAIDVTDVPTPSALLEEAERVRLLEWLLDQLDEGKRTLIVLSELEEWTLREIAEHLGSNTNTVYSRLRAAKREMERLYARWLAGAGARQGDVL